MKKTINSKSTNYQLLLKFHNLLHDHFVVKYSPHHIGTCWVRTQIKIVIVRGVVVHHYLRKLLSGGAQYLYAYEPRGLRIKLNRNISGCRIGCYQKSFPLQIGIDAYHSNIDIIDVNIILIACCIAEGQQKIICTDKIGEVN